MISLGPDQIVGEFVMRPDEHKKKRSAQYKKKHGDPAETTKTTKQKGSATPKSEPTVKSSTSLSKIDRDSPSFSASRGQKESELADLYEWVKLDSSICYCGQYVMAIVGLDAFRQS